MTAFFNTIRGRLVLLVLLALVPALAVQVYGAWRDLRGDIEVRKLESVRMASHAAADFEGLLTDTRAIFTDLLRTNEMRSPGNCTQVFTALRFAYERLAPETTNLGLADAQGNIYCAIIALHGERNLAGRPEFQAAIRTVDLAVGSYVRNPLSGAPQVSVAYPVLSFNGRVQAVIFATIATGWLENWHRESALPPGNAVTLLATDGTVLWRAVDGAPQPPQDAEAHGAAWLAHLRAGAPAIEGPDLDSVRRLHTVVPLQLGGQTAGYHPSGLSGGAALRGGVSRSALEAGPAGAGAGCGVGAGLAGQRAPLPAPAGRPDDRRATRAGRRPERARLCGAGSGRSDRPGAVFRPHGRRLAAA